MEQDDDGRIWRTVLGHVQRHERLALEGQRDDIGERQGSHVVWFGQQQRRFAQAREEVAGLLEQAPVVPEVLHPLAQVVQHLRHVAADSIENGVAIGHNLSEVPGIVVDDFIGSEPAHIFVVCCTRGRDDMGADMLGKLNGESRMTGSQQCQIRGGPLGQ